MKLGEVLLQDGRVSRRQLDEALQNQSRVGGRLGTSLLELGAVDEATLLAALGQQRSTRTVSREELARVPAAVVRMIPAKLAERYGIVPFRLKGRTLFVASRNIGDALKEDEIGFLTSCMVRTFIGLELRIYEALERYYHVAGPPRPLALAKRLEVRAAQAGSNGSSPTQEQPPPASTSGLAAPPAAAASRPAVRQAPKTPPPVERQPRLFVELDEADAALLGTSSSDDVDVWSPRPDEPVLLKPAPLPWLASQEAAAAGVPPAAAVAPVAQPVAAVAPVAAPLPAPPAAAPQAPAMPEPAADQHRYHELSLEDGLLKAAVELKSVEIRDDIADVLLAFCEPLFRRRLLLVARKDRIVGWRGEGEGVEEDRVRAIELRAGEPSVFLGLRSADSFWLGSLPRLAPNRALVDGLGGAFPKDCVVLPVVLRSRVVCYLYGDNLGDGVGGAPLADLRRLVAKAGLAFEVYILKNKLRTL